MNRFARQEQRPVQLINLALTGAGISDYVIQAADATRQAPDLIVICLAECTFLPLGPKFRTDADQMAFEPQNLGVVPWSFYWRHFTLSSAGDAATSVLFPLKRLDPLLRRQLARYGCFPKVLTRHIHFPHLNLVMDYLLAERSHGRPTSGGSYQDLPPVEDYRASMIDLLEVLRRGDVPVLFIWQENQPTRYSDEIRTTLSAAIAQYEFASAVDFGRDWNAELFSDGIHPTREHCAAYAHRHYDAICRTLDGH
jgi:hypothetical protein